MRTSKPVTLNLKGTETQRLVNLETELINIFYLLSLPSTSEAQKERLRALLARVEAELRNTPIEFSNAAAA